MVSWGAITPAPESIIVSIDGSDTASGDDYTQRLSGSATGTRFATALLAPGGSPATISVGAVNDTPLSSGSSSSYSVGNVATTAVIY